MANHSDLVFECRAAARPSLRSPATAIRALFAKKFSVERGLLGQHAIHGLADRDPAISGKRLRCLLDLRPGRIARRRLRDRRLGLRIRLALLPQRVQGRDVRVAPALQQRVAGR
jgi:hypothetical protein